MDKIYKRRHYFIDRKFQTVFILKFCLIVIASSVLVGGLVLFLSRNATTVAIENTKVLVKRTSDFLLPLMLETLAIVSLFSALSVALLSLFVSHKISGPLYRLQREIKFLGKLDLRRNFHIRAKDQLQELACSLEEMNSSLKEKIGKIQDAYGKLYNCLKEMPLNDEDKARISSLLEEIRRDLESFKT